MDTFANRLRSACNCLPVVKALRPKTLVSLVVLATLALPLTAHTQISGVSYTLIPSANYMLWDDDLGLEDGALYGGRLSANFGQIFALQGFYLANSDIKTDLSLVDLGDGLGEGLVDQKFEMAHYGADLVLNLGHGPVVPYLKGGAGVIHFNPRNGESFDQIALRAGAGAHFRLLERLSATVFVEDIMFRLDRNALSANGSQSLALAADPDEDDLRHNFGVGAGLNFSLGGQSAKETELDRAIRGRYAGGLFGASIPFEPYIGKVEFDNAAGLDDQAFVGLRTGVNFGPLVGLRAYYWHGMEDGLDDTEPVHSWGGEAQFNMNAGQGAIPYLLVGAGQLDFQSSYRDIQDQQRSDKGMLILGGGVGLSMGRHVRVNAAVRDYIFSEADADKVGSPDELLHNWSYSAGLSFAFGGSGGYDRPISEPMRPLAPTTTAPDQTVIVWEKPDGTREVISSPEQTGVAQSYQGDRLIALPVPAVGELYVRYGEPGGVTVLSESNTMSGTVLSPTPSPTIITTPGSTTGQVPAPTTDPEALRKIIREELADAGLKTSAMEKSEKPAVAETIPSGLTDEERLELMERRLAERLDERIDALMKRQLTQSSGTQPQSVVIVPEKDGSGSASEQSYQIEVVQEPFAKTFHVYSGLNVDDPSQLILGGRLDLGPVRRNSNFHFIPELAVGVFNKGSVMLAGNVQYSFGELLAESNLSPYVSGGLGFIRFGKGVDRDRTEGVLNLAYGVAKHFGNIIGFVEHQGVDLYSLHRINFGIRWIR